VDDGSWGLAGFDGLGPVALFVCGVAGQFTPAHEFHLSSFGGDGGGALNGLVVSVVRGFNEPWCF